MFKSCIADIVHERVLLMGPGRGGKTGLARSLAEKGVQKTASTLGIDMDKLTFFLDESEEGAYKLKPTNAADHLAQLAASIVNTVMRTEAHYSRQGNVSGASANPNQAAGAVRTALSKFFKRLDEARGLDEDTLHIDVWDLAGQMPFHALHDLVFSPERTTYCVVFNASIELGTPYADILTDEDGEDNQLNIDQPTCTYFDVIDSWLCTAREAITDNATAPIYLIGTHLDGMTEEDVRKRRRQLQQLADNKKYTDSIERVIFVDNTLSIPTAAGIVDTREMEFSSEFSNHSPWHQNYITIIMTM